MEELERGLGGERKRLKLLSIEDDEIDAIGLERAFKGADAQLESVTTLEDGKKKLKDNRYDIVLLDLHLPDSWPPETISEVSTRLNGAALIVLSSHIDVFRSIRAKAAEEPIIFFLPKDKISQPEFVPFVLFTGYLNAA